MVAGNERKLAPLAVFGDKYVRVKMVVDFWCFVLSPAPRCARLFSAIGYFNRGKTDFQNIFHDRLPLVNTGLKPCSFITGMDSLY